MITLTIDGHRMWLNKREINDLPRCLKNLSPNEDVCLVLKSHDVLYMACPIRKAVRYLKQAEYSKDHWIGERILPNKTTFIAGLLPSSPVCQAISQMSQYTFALRGVFLWADLLIKAYGPLPSGWCLILHEQHLLICEGGTLRISRLCHLPFHQELTLILRYLKRFGYQEDTTITLIHAHKINVGLPSFIHQSIRYPRPMSPSDLSLSIPALHKHRNLYQWSYHFRRMATVVFILNSLATGYFLHQSYRQLDLRDSLHRQLEQTPLQTDTHEAEITAFEEFQRLSSPAQNPLPLFRQLMAMIKNRAIATHIHWTANPVTLVLELEFTTDTDVDEFQMAVQKQFTNYRVRWQANENNPLIGLLTLEKENRD